MFQIHILSPEAIEASASVLRQVGHGSAPGAQPQNHGGCRYGPFTQRAAMSLAGVMPRFCPSYACVEALPPAPPSGPAFGGEIFEQVIELNEAIWVGPDPVDPVSLWKEEIRTQTPTHTGHPHKDTGRR